MLDDAAAFVGWIDGKRLSSGNAQRGFPSVEGFVVLVLVDVVGQQTSLVYECRS